MNILVTGGAGFIGSALVRHLIAATDASVVNLDKLTYAADPRNVASVAADPRYRFEEADIGDRAAMDAILARHRPKAVINLAAETHVDRSIDGPGAFVETNILGTFTLLEAALGYWRGLDAAGRAAFRFLHVSTDEVYGALGKDGVFTEESPYRPNSPYAATKAASDHLVRAWHRTYGLPAIISNCSNNYGPYQFPEKLIPLTVLRALAGEQLSIYGSGANVRDWLHVDDHARALHLMAMKGAPGRVYNVGGGGERSNLAVVTAICGHVDRLKGRPAGETAKLITFVADRPGHDFRYAIDGTRIAQELGFTSKIDWESGLARTVEWYLANESWWRPLWEKRYRGDRLGLAGGKS